MIVVVTHDVCLEKKSWQMIWVVVVKKNIYFYFHENYWQTGCELFVKKNIYTFDKFSAWHRVSSHFLEHSFLLFQG